MNHTLISKSNLEEYKQLYLVKSRVNGKISAVKPLPVYISNEDAGKLPADLFAAAFSTKPGTQVPVFSLEEIKRIDFTL